MSIDDLLEQTEAMGFKEGYMKGLADLYEREKEAVKRGWSAGHAFASAMHWHSVKDKLPEHETFVLVCTKGYLPRVALAHIRETHYLFLDPDCMRVQFTDITHWQPLPAAPMQEVNND